jgi:hypothetical protein
MMQNKALATTLETYSQHGVLQRGTYGEKKKKKKKKMATEISPGAFIWLSDSWSRCTVNYSSGYFVTIAMGQTVCASMTYVHNVAF